MHHRNRQAFSLIELSVVIVILGLLVGSILGGQSLIRAQRVRNVLADAKTYAMAMQQFKDKYGYLPGDFPSATNVWGSDATYCTSANDLTGGTCNGNGNGLIDYAAAVNVTAEEFQMWKQMALAGMITGTFTGINGAVNVNYDCVPGVNIPRGPLENSGFWFYNWGCYSAVAGSGCFTAASGLGTFYEGDYTNTMTFGKAVTSAWPYASALSGKEAFELDTKGDDGLPAYGSIRTLASGWSGAVNGGPKCTTSDIASAVYSKSLTDPVCMMLFLNTFVAPKS